MVTSLPHVWLLPFLHLQDQFLSEQAASPDTKLSIIRHQEKPLMPVDKGDQQAEGDHPEDAGAAPRGVKQTSRAVTHLQ
ncbi:hypothetical protein MC885_004323, partial [Smutsia gigantea]